jgi:GH25 family lysozyme M1 (1,4-beta-N-acetylmuramidase)
VQADFFADHAQYVAAGQTLPPMRDIEWPRADWAGLNVGYHMTPAQMPAWIGDFVGEVAARTGQRAMIYTATNWRIRAPATTRPSWPAWGRR